MALPVQQSVATVSASGHDELNSFSIIIVVPIHLDDGAEDGSRAPSFAVGARRKTGSYGAHRLASDPVPPSAPIDFPGITVDMEQLFAELPDAPEAETLL
jgi:hypothetical protein